MIRDATAADIPAIVDLGAQMLAESPRFSRLTFDGQRLAETLHHVLATGYLRVVEVNGVVVGGLMAMVSQHWASQDRVVCDLAVFVDRDHRGATAGARLLRDYAAWGKATGAKLILFGVMTGLDAEKVAAIAEAVGWQRAGIVMEIVPDVL